MSSRAEISIYGSCALEILPLPGRTEQQCRGYSWGGKGGMNPFTTNPTCAARLKVPITLECCPHLALFKLSYLQLVKRMWV